MLTPSLAGNINIHIIAQKFYAITHKVIPSLIYAGRKNLLTIEIVGISI